MAYWTDVAKVVGGTGVAALLWELLQDVTFLGDALALLPFFLIAVSVAVHGVFTGIEAAVAAGRRSDNDADEVTEDAPATSDGTASGGD